MDTVTLAKRAYSGLEAAAGRKAREAQDYQSYFDALAEDVILKFGVPAGTPIGQQFRGKKNVVGFWAELAPTLFENVYLDAPLEFIGSGKRIVVLGRETYKIRASDVTVHGKAFAAVLEFKGDRIVMDHQIKEMSEFVDACRAA